MYKVVLKYIGKDNFQVLMNIYNKDNEMVKQAIYDSDIKLGHDFSESLGNICSKTVIDNRIILKDDCGNEFDVEDSEKLKLTNIIDNKLNQSFKNIYKSLLKEQYKCVYLLASKNRFSIDRLSSAPNKRDTATLMCELELNKDGNLTENSVSIINMIVGTELTSWSKIFFTKFENNVLKVFYDDKSLITTNKAIIQQIKPIADAMENKYLDYLEKRKDGRR